MEGRTRQSALLRLAVRAVALRRAITPAAQPVLSFLVVPSVDDGQHGQAAGAQDGDDGPHHIGPGRVAAVLGSLLVTVWHRTHPHPVPRGNRRPPASKAG